MKNLFFVLLLSTTLFAQRKDVAFIHGLMGDVYTWNDTANKLKEEYFINITNEEYDESERISSTANSYQYKIPNNSVVVAHSMGGLLAREMIRNYGTGDFSALITTGTPHIGAQIAEVPGNAAALTVKWLWDIARPWVIVYGSSSTGIAIAELYIKNIYNDIDDYVNVAFDLLKPSMQDIARNSPFLNTLNSNPSSTFPDAHYTIWGDEDWMMPWRLADTKINNKETGDAWNINRKLQAYYVYFSMQSSSLSQDYWYVYQQTWDPEDYNKYMYFLSLAVAFGQGANSLEYLQQIEWDYWVTGSYYKWEYPDYYSWKNDAVVPVYSQAPSFVIGERYLQAEHTNHLEETLPYGDGLQRIKDAFNRYDIQVPLNEEQQDPLTVYISGPSTLVFGQTGTFTANPSGGSGAYTDYRWWEKNDGSGGGELFGDKNVINAPIEGEWYELTSERGKKSIQRGGNRSWNFSLKVEVTDSEGNKKTDIHSVVY